MNRMEIDGDLRNTINHGFWRAPGGGVRGSIWEDVRAGAHRTTSVQLLWPFLQAARVDVARVPALARGGFSADVLANPNARVPSELVPILLRQLVEVAGSSELGLLVAEVRVPGSFGLVEQAASCGATLREAIELICRYFPLLDESVEIDLVEHGDVGMWRFRSRVRQVSPRPMNDFLMTFAMFVIRRYTGRVVPILEARFAHREATNLWQYTRRFGTRRRMEMGENAVILPRSAMDYPCRYANPALCKAFVERADRCMRELKDTTRISCRLRAVVQAQMSTGRLSVEDAASALGLSQPALMRRLRAEGTTHGRVLDEVRHSLACAYLESSNLPIRSISSLLGFSDDAAFCKAFRRWEGDTTPTELRRRLT